MRQVAAIFYFLLLFFALVHLPAVQTGASAQDAPGAQEPQAERPLIFVRSSHAEPAEVPPGGSFELFVELHNVGNAGAVNLMVSFTGENFVPEGSSSLKNVGSLQVNEHATVSQRLRVASGASGGSYPVNVRLDYQGDNGLPYNSTEVVGVSVLAPTPTPRAQAAGRPQLVIESFSTDPALPRPGQPFTLTLVIHNVGSGAARNALLTNGTPSVFAPVGAGNVIAVGDVGWDKTAQVSARLIAEQAVKAGSHIHPVVLDYDNVAGEHQQSSQNIALLLDEAPVQGDSEPLVVISTYNVDPPEPGPGQPFTLTMVVQNVGGGGARGVTIALNSGPAESDRSTAFAPLGTGNVRYLPGLEASATSTITAQFIVAGAAAAGVYVMNVTFEYRGTADTALTRTEQISLIVRMPPQLQVAFYRPIDSPSPGQPFDLPVEIFNVGRDRLNSTNAEIKSSDLDILSQPVYIAPLDPGTSVTIDGQAVVDTPGPKLLSIRVHYIDDFNKAQVYEQEMTVEVSEPLEMPPGVPEGMEPGGMQNVIEDRQERPILLRVLRGLLGLGSA